MSLLAPHHRALLVSLTLVAFFGGDGLHGLLHHDLQRPAESGPQAHGEDCDDCAERKELPDSAHCLLCSSSRSDALTTPSAQASVDTAPARCTGVQGAADELTRGDVRCAPLGARAPPRGA